MARCRCSKSRPTAIFAESNAILWYVAGGTALAPEDRIERAEALQWMFFEQHSLEPNIRRRLFLAGADQRRPRPAKATRFEDWLENGDRALGVMEMHLAKYPYFVANRFTIADIALYAYAHVANQCDFDLKRYPAVCDWIDRIAAEPGYVAMDWQPEPLLAAQ